MKLKSLEIINSGTRISSIDIFRCLAILPVVFYHFHHFLPYGNLGVDLFFVISGFLVGSILIKKFKKGQKINFFEFVLQRGFKIWPSYYTFLLVGGLLALLFFTNYSPDFIIPRSDYPRYLFFYRNYTGLPRHWIFDHVWSLCVEEHFYILLPVMIIIIKGIFSNNRVMLLAGTTLLIVSGIGFKFLSVHYTNSQDTYAGTHNRLDALGWGVLLGIIISYYGDRIRDMAWRKSMFIAGIFLFAVNLFLQLFGNSYSYEKIAFHSLVPFSFFLMILGAYYYDFSKWKPFRFVAYYSYNWYLWHPISVWIITKYFGINLLSFVIYLVISFLLAIFFTITVEERFLKIRGPVLNRIFRKRIGVVA